MNDLIHVIELSNRAIRGPRIDANGTLTFYVDKPSAEALALIVAKTLEAFAAAEVGATVPRQP